MNLSSFRKDLISRRGIPGRFLRALILTAGAACLGLVAVLRVDWQQQAVLGLFTVCLAFWMNRSSTSNIVTLTLVLVSCYATFRYGYWRVVTTFNFFSNSLTRWSSIEAFFIGLLLVAEVYAFFSLFLGYVQTIWPLRRSPVALPDDPTEWPDVDLLIPTSNEPLSLVRYTALAAINIDWPADKLNVYILDDGKREEFRAFAEEAGIGYMTRDDNKHGKAGSINSALKRLSAPFVTIFDCDHVPTRSFLQVAMGGFIRDGRLGMLQTPHHFYSPDPFERNLDQFHTIPNEGELFYQLLQDGNDFWNATVFCGSCAIMRRAALDKIGGVAVDTVTEDALTSLRLQRNGYNTAYLNIPQAAGLETESLARHIRQRIRWAQGMIQIVRTENPLFARGLKLGQRICYLSAMSRLLSALPRLVFLITPLIYLVLGQVNIPGYWAAILAYALPHLVLSSITNSRIQGQHRHSFWDQIYEAILAPFILLPTLIALVSPRSPFSEEKTTEAVVAKRRFDAQFAAPFLVMLVMDVVGLLIGVARLHYFSWWPLRIWFDQGHAGMVVMNMLWTVCNMMILGVCTAVAWEGQQRRSAVRMTMAVPADVMFADGTLVPGVTVDISTGGVALTIEDPIELTEGTVMHLTFSQLDGESALPATLVAVDGGIVRARFETLTLQEQEVLTMVLYSRADTWLGWSETREVDRPMRSLRRIFSLSMWGFQQIGWRFLKRARRREQAKLLSSVTPMIVLALLFGSCMATGSAAQVHGRVAAATSVGNIANTRSGAQDLLPKGTHGLSGLYMREEMLSRRFPWIFPLTSAGVTILISLCMAVVLRSMLRERARMRLLGTEPGSG